MFRAHPDFGPHVLGQHHRKPDMAIILRQLFLRQLPGLQRLPLASLRLACAFGLRGLRHPELENTMLQCRRYFRCLDFYWQIDDSKDFV
jgi:hypothetical protein